MSVSQKRKNDIVVSDYDQTWWARVYRRLHWDITEEIIIKASAEDCLGYIQPDKTRTIYDLITMDASRLPYHYRVTTLSDKRPYRFTIQIGTPSGRGQSYMAYVSAKIEPYGEDHQSSLITFRTYPHGFFFIIGVMVAVIVMTTMLLSSSSAPPPTQASNTAVGLGLFVMLAAFAMASGHFLLIMRRKALAIVIDHFVSLSGYELGKPRAAWKARRMIYNSQKASRSAWRIILPFDDEMTTES